MSKESLPIKVRGNLIRIDSKVFTEKFIFLRRRKRKRLQKRRKTKRFWGMDIFKERKSQGDFYNLVEELRLGDCEYYVHGLRRWKVLKYSM